MQTRWLECNDKSSHDILDQCSEQPCGLNVAQTLMGCILIQSNVGTSLYVSSVNLKVAQETRSVEKLTNSPFQFSCDACKGNTEIRLLVYANFFQSSKPLDLPRSNTMQHLTGQTVNNLWRQQRGGRHRGHDGHARMFCVLFPSKYLLWLMQRINNYEADKPNHNPLITNCSLLSGPNHGATMMALYTSLWIGRQYLVAREKAHEIG